MVARTNRRHAQGDESRDRILDAATEIAAQRGYEGTTIAAVSKKSGLPGSSIYWHFASKDLLLAAVIERSFERWMQAVLVATTRPPGRDVGTHVITSLRQQAAALTANPDFIRLGLLLSLEERPKEPTAKAMFLDARRRTLAATIDGFDRTIRHLRGRGNRRLAEQLAALTLAAADGLFIAHQLEPDDKAFEQRFGLLADMVIRYLGD